MGIFKNYEELEFTDDFMFAKILSSDMGLCRDLLELILGQKIRKVNLVESQKTVAITGDNKGVRFDVYTESEEGTVYDIEMQTTTSRNLAKRSRYYHSMIDLNMLEKGGKYDDLRKSFVIFLCSDGLDDSKPLPVYTYRMRSDEDSSEYLNDGTVTVFLNANGSSEGMSSEMREFLQYLKDGEAGDDDGLVGHIHKLLIQARNHEEWKVEYMTLKLKLEETREEGRLIGIEEGRKEGRKEDRAMLSKLFHRLQETGRGAEFAKAMSDGALLDKLLKEHGLSD